MAIIAHKIRKAIYSISGQILKYNQKKHTNSATSLSYFSTSDDATAFSLFSVFVVEFVSLVTLLQSVSLVICFSLFLGDNKVDEFEFRCVLFVSLVGSLVLSQEGEETLGLLRIRPIMINNTHTIPFTKSLNNVQD
jgi:hypothetical protein